MAFPIVPTSAAGRILSSANTSPAGTHTFPNLSSLTKTSGDLLIAVIVTYDGNSTNAEFSAWGGGFTEFVDQATTTTMGIGAAWKVSNGTESGTFTVTSADTSTNDSQCILMSIIGAHGVSPPEGGTIANGTTAAADPGALDPAGWNTEEALWIAVAGNGEDSTTGTFTVVTGAPANYNNLFATTFSADVVGGVGAGVAFRQLSASSENVGTFTVDVSNARNSALLIAVRAQPTFDPYQRDVRDYRAERFFRPSTEPIQLLGDATTPADAAATNANAETAAITLAAQDATVEIASSAENAAITLTGQDAVAAVGVNAECATISFAAQDATGQGGTVADPNQAAPQVAWMFTQPNAASFQLLGDSTSLVTATANAESAAITLTAHDATAALSANADVAALAITANDAAAGVAVNADCATWTLASNDATALAGANAGQVSVTFITNDATTAVGANADNTLVVFTANDATVQVSGATNAQAECATWSLTAADATTGISPNADAVQVTWAAFDALVAIAAAAELASVTLNALDVSLTPPVIAYIEVAGSSTASVVGASSTGGVVEGGTAPTGASS